MAAASFSSFTPKALKFLEIQQTGAVSAFTLAPTFPDLFLASTRGSDFLTEIILCSQLWPILPAQEANAEFFLEGGKGNVFLSVIFKYWCISRLDVIFFSESFESVCCRQIGGESWDY